MWNARLTGFAPVELHVWLPVFVTFTVSVLASAQYASMLVGIVYEAAKRAVSTTAGARNGVPPICASQPTPSRTRSIVSVYVPPAGGVLTFALTVPVAPGAAAGGGGVPP